MNNLLQDLLIGGAGIITTTVSSIVSWGLAKKKYNTEVDHSLIHNMEKSLEFYTKLADDNSSRLDAISQENLDLRNEVHELRTQLMRLAFNLCMNANCPNRQREEPFKLKSNAKTGSRLDITEKDSRRRRKPSESSGDNDKED